MKVKLIFYDWQDKNGKSIYNTLKGVQISMGDFHSGTTFDGEIYLDAEQEVELKEHLQDGYHPIFGVSKQTTAKEGEVKKHKSGSRRAC